LVDAGGDRDPAPVDRLLKLHLQSQGVGLNRKRVQKVRAVIQLEVEAVLLAEGT